MFTDMTALIGQGKLPDRSLLAKKFHAALTKKFAVVGLPPAFRMTDPKINPRADHLLWAAILLEDREGYDLVVSLIAAELAEKTGNHDPKMAQQQKISAIIRSLYKMAPSRRFREQLMDKVRKIAPDTAGGPPGAMK